MKIIVVDCSVAVKWFVREKFSSNAIQLLKDFKDGLIDLHAPYLIQAEFTNAIRKYYLSGVIDESTLSEITNIIKKLPINYHSMDWDMIDHALRIAINFNITVYDSIYFTLAENVNGTVITADERFYNATRKSEKVIFIGDYR
ncbi:MAG: type II toxin-antitoxin system VapC family toxin [Candidatus Odinarchaeota archaeon]|nr:type II toxin-antitoxin system VapC family toxin [Candidatus Odinarchaeota archaeon]